jgi:hypothetical protein
MAHVEGVDDGVGFGVKGQSTGAIEAGNQGIGVWGLNSGTGIAVFGDGQNGIGVEGVSSSTETATSTANSTNVGVMAVSDNGDGLFGSGGRNGIHGQSASATDSGVWGENTGAGVGVAGSSVHGPGISGASTSGNAGEFHGNVLVTGNIFLGGADCAEDFDVAAPDVIEPGTVMALNADGRLEPSWEAYEKKVVGVISGAGDYKPGIVLDKRPQPSNRASIALMGKVYAKVDARYGPIDVGDLLTSSPTAGHAMKADNPIKAFGAVIGKALRPLPSGQGLIPILIALQ